MKSEDEIFEEETLNSKLRRAILSKTHAYKPIEKH